METVKVMINGKNYMVEKGSTILQACKHVYIDIPTLCYMKRISEEGSCGLCLVEIKGQRLLKRACITKVTEGMEIYTNTEKVRQARRINLALILSNHKRECLLCGKFVNCELRTISERLSLREVPFDSLESDGSEAVLFSNGKLKMDTSKCILCQRCINLCGEILGAGVFALINRGIKTNISIIEDKNCIGCGHCSVICPTGAIQENNSTMDITRYREIAIDRTCFQVISYDEIKEKKFITALRRIGFEKVYSFDELWNLCIKKLIKEIEAKLEENKKGIFITICPAWERYLEVFYPELMKSEAGFHPVKFLKKDILPVVSCSAISDAMTINQLLNFLNENGINIKSLPLSYYDSLYNEQEKGFSFNPFDFVKKILQNLTDSKELRTNSIRGLNRVWEIKTVSTPIIKAVVTDSIYQAIKFLHRIKREKSEDYHIFHVMACPEGCIGGGGQPISIDNRKNISGSYYGIQNRKRLTW